MRSTPRSTHRAEAALAALRMGFASSLAAWPVMAGRALFIMNGGDGMLSPWLGFGVFLLYAVIVLAAAALVLRRRDA